MPGSRLVDSNNILYELGYHSDYNYVIIYIPHAGYVFKEEPKDVEVLCESANHVKFSCKHNLGNESNLRWIINSTVYELSALPKNHIHNGTTLLVKDVGLTLNNTLYVCELSVANSLTNRSCIYKSKGGLLIIRECSGKL